MKTQHNFIFETDFWIVFLHPDQKYLGRCVVELKRECGDLADLIPEEADDFILAARKLETAARKAFSATMFNWTCLMNRAYLEQAPKPQMHWHFRPRYDHAVNFSGTVFVDPEFGHHYSLEVDKLDKELLNEVANSLRRAVI